jgi:hypothetical protein
MWMKFPVGGLQRAEIQQRCGFPRGAFRYNEGPTSSCHTFCWKARHRFDVPFFYLPQGLFETFTPLRDMNVRCKG